VGPDELLHPLNGGMALRSTLAIRRTARRRDATARDRLPRADQIPNCASYSPGMTRYLRSLLGRN
jgi:hypothetical protein